MTHTLCNIIAILKFHCSQCMSAIGKFNIYCTCVYWHLYINRLTYQMCRFWSRIFYLMNQTIGSPRFCGWEKFFGADYMRINIDTVTIYFIDKLYTDIEIMFRFVGCYIERFIHADIKPSIYQYDTCIFIYCKKFKVLFFCSFFFSYLIELFLCQGLFFND